MAQQLVPTKFESWIAARLTQSIAWEFAGSRDPTRLF